jgi:HEAT repeat protein
VAKALTQLSSKQPMTQCDAALLLGRLGSREQVPPLIDLLNASTFTSVRGCAASALVDLGETDTAMAAYTEWAQGRDADLRRSALVGFGHIGPSAADVALPYLTEALKSPHMDVRYLAVDSLAKLGPAALPLLEVASGDADKDVRARAARALSARTRR